MLKPDPGSLLDRGTGGLGHHQPEGMFEMLMFLFPKLEPVREHVRKFVFEEIPLGTAMQKISFEIIPKFVVQIHKQFGIDIEPSEAGNCTWLRDMMEVAARKKNQL